MLDQKQRYDIYTYYVLSADCLSPSHRTLIDFVGNSIRTCKLTIANRHFWRLTVSYWGCSLVNGKSHCKRTRRREWERETQTKIIVSLHTTLICIIRTLIGEMWCSIWNPWRRPGKKRKSIIISGFPWFFLFKRPSFICRISRGPPWIAKAASNSKVPFLLQCTVMYVFQELHSVHSAVLQWVFEIWA